MAKTLSADIEFSFKVDKYWEGKPKLNLQVSNILPISGYSMSDYNNMASEIGECTFEQDDLSGLDLASLDEEKSYTGKGKIEIEYSESGWEVIEYDVFMSLHVDNYSEVIGFYVGDDFNYGGRPYFETRNVPSHNSIKIKELSPTKLFIETSFDCIGRKIVMTVDKFVSLIANREHE